MDFSSATVLAVHRTQSGARGDGGRSGPLSLEQLPGPVPARIDDDAISDMRMALNQGQPLRDSRFLADIGKAADQRREPRPRGRPRKPAWSAVGIEPQLPLKI